MFTRSYDDTQKQGNIKNAIHTFLIRNFHFFFVTTNYEFNDKYFICIYSDYTSSPFALNIFTIVLNGWNSSRNYIVLMLMYDNWVYFVCVLYVYNVHTTTKKTKLKTIKIVCEL